MGRWILYLTGAANALLFGIAQPAFADAIDGDWCRADGKRMTIRGLLSSRLAGSRRAATTRDIPFRMSFHQAKPALVPRSRSNCSANTSLTHAKTLMLQYKSGDGASQE